MARINFADMTCEGLRKMADGNGQLKGMCYLTEMEKAVGEGGEGCTNLSTPPPPTVSADKAMKWGDGLNITANHHSKILVCSLWRLVSVSDRRMSSNKNDDIFFASAAWLLGDVVL